LLQDGARRAGAEWLRFPMVALRARRCRNVDFEPALLAEFVEDARYAPYLERQEAEVAQLRGNDKVRLAPISISRPSRSFERDGRERLGMARPGDLGRRLAYSRDNSRRRSRRSSFMRASTAA
jgi:tRNA uridine 5-carboxymethylaminomethyl modification enzyme